MYRMKLYTIGLALAAGLGGISCSSSNTSRTGAMDSGERAALVSKSGATFEQAQSTSKHGQDGRGTPTPGPTIPKDAQWTILCATITGPDHAARGRTARSSLIE